jgi:AH receptor-interacting protein
VVFHFVAKTHPEGKVLDDSRTLGPGKPFELLIGKKFLLPCWETAVASMVVGQTTSFVAESSATSGYSTLASVLRRQAREADKVAQAEAAARGHGHSHSHDAQHSSGGSSCSCAMAMDPGDLDLHMLGSTALEFELELLSVVLPGNYIKEDWELSWKQKAVAVPKLKEEGNVLFKVKDYDGAGKKWVSLLIPTTHIRVRVRIYVRVQPRMHPHARARATPTCHSHSHYHPFFLMLHLTLTPGTWHLALDLSPGF